ncbi:MAG: hypothetical protein ACMUIU_11720 [bacterium]
MRLDKKLNLTKYHNCEARVSGPLFVHLSILVICLFILICSKNIFSFDAQITWDENEEENIAGYKIFCRKEGYQGYNYNAPVWTGTDTTCSIYDLNDTNIYYFVARAFNTAGIESENSEELKVELIDGEIKVSTTTDSYNFVGNGCFITSGDSGL